MFIPPVLALFFSKRYALVWKLIIGGLLGILLIGMVLSYTRAAWVSLAAVGALYGLMRVGFKLKTLLLLGTAGLAAGTLVLDSLLIQLERNDQDSSDDLAEHVESISNVSSDASNLERLNRWSCALALFQEHPFVGWGPGTYQFVYAPFQRSEHLTIISTNNADGGNAHSEYLGPLAEQGLPGALFMLGLFGWVLHLGFKIYRKLQDPEERLLATGVFLGLVTYFVHGVLNNYLDTDKASAPFWGFIALLVVWDLHSEKKQAAN
jgi:O-antigen ligase